MNVHVSYRVPKSSDFEQHINQGIEKLNRRLQVFKPELVHFHAIIEERPARAGYEARLNLRLPSGDIAARGNADRGEAAIKSAFEDMIEQVTKHKDHLRAQHKWPRQRRVAQSREVAQVPFEETIAAVQPETVSEEDIATYIDANFARLQRFVERELRYRENNGELRAGQLNPQEVVSEAIANALGREERPEKLALEPWLYRLSLRAIRDLAHRDGDGRDTVNLDQPARGHETRLNVGSDEAMLQFHQPDDSVTTESLIPNHGVATPEEAAASDEMISLVEMALAGAGEQDREAFLLFSIEGFTVEEIAAISSRKVDEVRKSIRAAREHLRKSLPLAGDFKDKLLQHSTIA
jgi:DNA-directed RNA polymerase specialized sigma24 family protein/ribosome-associated translation inhibitor RaiA